MTFTLASPLLGEAFAGLPLEDRRLLGASYVDGRDDVGLAGEEERALGRLRQEYLRLHSESADTWHCTDAHAVLAAAAASSAPAPELPARTRVHLGDCAACAEAVHELAQIPVALGALLGPLVDPGLPDPFLPAAPTRWRRRVVLGLSAAMLVGVVGASVAVVRRDGGTVNDTAESAGTTPALAADTLPTTQPPVLAAAPRAAATPSVTAAASSPPHRAALGPAPLTGRPAALTAAPTAAPTAPSTLAPTTAPTAAPTSAPPVPVLTTPAATPAAKCNALQVRPRCQQWPPQIPAD